MKMNVRCIGEAGFVCVLQRRMEVWVSMIFASLTRPCCLSKGGNLSSTLTPSLAEFTKPNITLIAKVPNHSSFIWRSLASARDLIGKGSRWRVGNGNKIRIWQDNWIPR